MNAFSSDMASAFWRIFKVKTKSSPATVVDPVDRPETQGSTPDEWDVDGPPNLERSRSRGDRMSVSRSGRFKQKSRRRSGLFDNPNLVSGKKGTPSPPDYENDENCMHQANGHRNAEPIKVGAAKDASLAKPVAVVEGEPRRRGRPVNDSPVLQTTL